MAMVGELSTKVLYSGTNGAAHLAQLTVVQRISKAESSVYTDPWWPVEKTISQLVVLLLGFYWSTGLNKYDDYNYVLTLKMPKTAIHSLTQSLTHSQGQSQISG